MKNIANADRPKSVAAMLPPRPLRRSGKVAQTACNSDRREGKSCIPTLNQTFADSRILKISKFRTFRIAAVKSSGDDSRAHDSGGMRDVNLIGHECARANSGHRNLGRIDGKASERIGLRPRADEPHRRREQLR